MQHPDGEDDRQKNRNPKPNPGPLRFFHIPIRDAFPLVCEQNSRVLLLRTAHLVFSYVQLHHEPSFHPGRDWCAVAQAEGGAMTASITVPVLLGFDSENISRIRDTAAGIQVC
jgi:hypothetical protein